MIHFSDANATGVYEESVFLKAIAISYSLTDIQM